MWYKKTMRKEQLEAQIEKVKAELLKLGPMRPGSLSQQYSACQKPGCKCVDPVHPQKHGPFYQLSYTHRRQEHHPVRSSSVCSGGAQAARHLQEIQSSHPAMGHAGPRTMQTRNARSALGGLPIGAYPAVLSLHPASENARTLPTSCFPASGLALAHFFSFSPQRIAQARSE